MALFAAVVIQLTVVNRLPLPGAAAPDLVLLLVAAIAVATGPATGAITGFAGGLALDIAPPAAHYAGEYALVFCLVGYAAARVVRAIWDVAGEHDPVTVFTVMAVAVAAGEAGKAALGMLLSDPDVTTAAVSRVLPAAILYDLLLSPLVFWLVTRVTRGAVGWRAVSRSTGPERAPAPGFGVLQPASVFRQASAGAAPKLRLAGTGEATEARHRRAGSRSCGCPAPAHRSQPPNECGWLRRRTARSGRRPDPAAELRGKLTGAAGERHRGAGPCGPRARTGSGRRRRPPPPRRGGRRTPRHGAGCARAGRGRPGAARHTSGRTGARPRSFAHGVGGTAHAAGSPLAARPARSAGEALAARSAPSGLSALSGAGTPLARRRSPSRGWLRGSARPRRRCPGRGTRRAAAGSAAPGRPRTVIGSGVGGGAGRSGAGRLRAAAFKHGLPARRPPGVTGTPRRRRARGCGAAVTRGASAASGCCGCVGVGR